MKSKLFLTTVFSLALIGSIIANPIRTALNLRMFDGRPISVLVDGIPFGTVASQQEILNLSPGIHRLKVFAVQQHPFGWNHGAMIPVFRGNVEIFSDYAMYTFVDRFGKLVIEDYEALYCEPVPPACPAHGHLPGYSPYPNNTQFPNNGSGFHGSTCSLPGNGNSGNGWENNNGGGNGNYRAPMNQNDFNQLLGTIESKSFESTKQQIALGAISNSYFTSEQIRQMLNVFTFESTKIEVAKKAYERVIDPEKFYVVYNSFTFESSIDNLQASLSR